MSRCSRGKQRNSNKNRVAMSFRRGLDRPFAGARLDISEEGRKMTKLSSAGGLSQTRLSRMHDVMAGHVEAGDMPGLVTLVSRHGEIHVDLIGRMAFDGAPMQRDTIFRIASMTKTITAVAAMILVEECKIRLDDPVDRWQHELHRSHGSRPSDPPLDLTPPPQRQI